MIQKVVMKSEQALAYLNLIRGGEQNMIIICEETCGRPVITLSFPCCQSKWPKYMFAMYNFATESMCRL
jgi:hypothetical protein